MTTQFQLLSATPKMQSTLLRILFLFLVVVFACGWLQRPTSIRNLAKLEKTRKISRIATLVTASTLLRAPKVHAVQGKVGASSLEETKVAVKTIQAARDGTNDMDKLAAAKDYAGIAKLLNEKQFQELEPAFTTLVRSDAISSEDKVSLGTIKRYGTVADALIMLGGLSSELRAGGFEVAGEKPKLEQAIEDDEEPDENKSLDPAEVKKYIKLSRDSLNDICRIGLPVLNK